MLKQFLICDAIPSYLKMSYVKMSYAILISLLRYCGDAVIQPRVYLLWIFSVVYWTMTNHQVSNNQSQSNKEILPYGFWIVFALTSISKRVWDLRVKRCKMWQSRKAFLWEEKVFGSNTYLVRLSRDQGKFYHE